MITKRGFLGSAGAALVLGGGAARAAGDAAQGQATPDQEALARIETASGGRLGVAVHDTGSGARLAYRADERFPLCSTFKLLAAAAILAQVDQGRQSLEQAIPYAQADLVENSPTTTRRLVEGTMPLGDLCEAAITLSDNTAGNLMLGTIGGPAGLTAFARSIGDAQTRLDRTEPTLNEALPNDPRDTTTPAAMAADLHALLLGDRLSAASRAQLDAWLLGCRTCDTRMRAGLPRDWRTGGKTGSGERGTTNDVGILRPPGRSPILAAVYLTGASGTAADRNATIAAVGRVIAGAMGGR